MPRVQRLDAELVRRGLARSREQAVELIAAGRVAGARRRRHQGRRPASTPTRRSVVRADDDRSRTTPRAAGTSWPARWPRSRTSASPAGAASTRARRPAGSPTSCCAPGRARSSPSTSVTASWPGRCAPTSGCDVHDRTNVRALTPGDDRRPGRADRRRPVLHLAAPRAARAGRLHAPRRRPAADGQAAVRGRPGAARQRRGGARPRRCAPRRSCAVAAAAAELGWPAAAWSAARCRGRRATWNSSCGCGDAGRVALPGEAEIRASWRGTSGRAGERRTP